MSVAGFEPANIVQYNRVIHKIMSVFRPFRLFFTNISKKSTSKQFSGCQRSFRIQNFRPFPIHQCWNPSIKIYLYHGPDNVHTSHKVLYIHHFITENMDKGLGTSINVGIHTIKKVRKHRITFNICFENCSKFKCR